MVEHVHPDAFSLRTGQPGPNFLVNLDLPHPPPEEFQSYKRS
jgi:hypothetical protein